MTNREKGSKQPKLNSAEKKISRILRQARLKNNYSINDLYKITKIKPKYLKDLEKGAFNKLPDRFYVRAFINNYANGVGLNGEGLLRRFNNQLPDFQDPQYLNQVSRNHLLANVERQASRNRHLMIRRYIPLVSVFIVIFLALIGVWIVSAHYHNNLATNSNNYSTKISGAPLSSSNKVRHHYKRRSQIKIIRRNVKGLSLNYEISTHQSSIRMGLMSNQPKKITIKTNDKSQRLLVLKTKRAKSVKIPANDRQILLNFDSLKNLKIHLNHRLLKVGQNSSIRSIRLRFKR